tara:strand:+ start:227 stop:553 length:327 start_codon:yes stop_codon:yes gene_type:complete
VLCCSYPIKITKVVDKYPKRYDSPYQNQLVIYFSLDEIEEEFTVIANIQLNNNEIYGNLNYDTRMKDYLLNRINRIKADALIYNENLSNTNYTYFDAISFNREQVLNP